METRKLQRTGGVSLSMTIPKKWTDSFDLRDKDEVKIYFQKSGLLLLQPSRSKNQLLNTIMLLGGLDNEMITRELIAHYISGSDQVLIKGKKITKNQRDRIREVCKLLLGYEIIEESSGEIMIKNIFDVVKFPVSQNIEKMFNIATSMFSDTMESLAHNNRPLSSDIIDRDFEINKLNMAIKRQFSKLLQDKMFDEEVDMNSADMKYYETIATQLERIADHAVKIARTVIAVDKKMKSTASARLGQIAKKNIAMLSDSKEMVKKIDKKMAHGILDKSLTMEKAISLNAKSASSQEVMIVDSLDLLRKRIMNMAEATIDHAIIKSI